ncbi:Putative BglB-family transcriptional antiterminator [Klebsiella variicola]|nr:Putative BglB-family transcriptional antiterminator [Klebsiella variicola]
MRFPNQRLAQLFTLLRDETLPQDELAQRLSVSTRTVRADITALNALLAQYGAQFILNRGSGYQLKIDNPASFQALEETAPKTQHVPRTAQDRITFLLVRFLTSAFSIKLEDLADEWFVSRATLQNDMVEVRERFQRYQLTLETRPRHGMKLFGSEVSIRACLTDLLWETDAAGRHSSVNRRRGAGSGCPCAAGAGAAGDAHPASYSPHRCRRAFYLPLRRSGGAPR